MSREVRQTGVHLEGRIIGRERLVKATNQKVTFYSLNTVKGWIQLTIDRSIDMNKIEVPGLVKVLVTSVRNKHVVTDDGREFNNKIAYVAEVVNIDASPEFQDYEQARLEEKLNELT